MKKTSPRFQVRQERHQVTRLFDEWPGAWFDIDTELIGDHVGQGGLAQPGGAIEQKVIHRFHRAHGRLATAI